MCNPEWPYEFHKFRDKGSINTIQNDETGGWKIENQLLILGGTPHPDMRQVSPGISWTFKTKCHENQCAGEEVTQR